MIDYDDDDIDAPSAGIVALESSKSSKNNSTEKKGEEEKKEFGSDKKGPKPSRNITIQRPDKKEEVKSKNSTNATDKGKEKKGE